MNHREITPLLPGLNDNKRCHNCPRILAFQQNHHIHRSITRGSADPLIHQPPRDLVHPLLWQSSYLKSELGTFQEEIKRCTIYVLMWFDPLKVCMYDIRDIRDIIKVCSSKMKLKVKVNVKRRRSLTITIRSAQYRGCSTKEDSTRLALWYRSLDGEFSAKVDVSVIFA